jgi:hypothetical protein
MFAVRNSRVRKAARSPDQATSAPVSMPASEEGASVATRLVEA